MWTRGPGLGLAHADSSISPDPSRTYNEDEERQLAENLFEIASRVYAGEFLEQPLLADLLCLFHREIFKGVRPWAGRHRSVDQGSDVLTFGPHRSFHRSRVVEEFARVFREVHKSVASFEDNPTAPEYDESALRLAAWTHAELIRIHPFEDGNGRSCRLFMNQVLLRVGLRPIAIEVPEQEYIGCLNHYYVTGDIVPLVDLCLLVYPLL